jgi:hypothetical protein
MREGFARCLRPAETAKGLRMTKDMLQRVVDCRRAKVEEKIEVAK